MQAQGKQNPAQFYLTKSKMLKSQNLTFNQTKSQQSTFLFEKLQNHKIKINDLQNLYGKKKKLVKNLLFNDRSKTESSIFDEVAKRFCQTPGTSYAQCFSSGIQSDYQPNSMLVRKDERRGASRQEGRNSSRAQQLNLFRSQSGRKSQDKTIKQVQIINQQANKKMDDGTTIMQECPSNEEQVKEQLKGLMGRVKKMIQNWAEKEERYKRKEEEMEKQIKELKQKLSQARHKGKN